MRRYVLVNCALYHGRPWQQQQQQQMLGHHSAAFRRLLRQLLICAIHGDLCVSSSIHFLPPRQPRASNLKRGGDTSNVLVNTHSLTATSVVATLRHRPKLSHFDYYPENARKQYTTKADRWSQHNVQDTARGTGARTDGSSLNLHSSPFGVVVVCVIESRRRRGDTTRDIATLLAPSNCQLPTRALPTDHVHVCTYFE